MCDFLCHARRGRNASRQNQGRPAELQTSVWKEHSLLRYLCQLAEVCSVDDCEDVKLVTASMLCILLKNVKSSLPEKRKKVVTSLIQT